MVNKYGAKKTQVNGIWFASGAEAQRYRDLMLLQRAGEVVEVVLQPVYILMEGRVNKATGKKIASIKYMADFLVTYADGHQEIEDVKGFKTAVYELKKRMFMIQYPDLYIKEVSA